MTAPSCGGSPSPSGASTPPPPVRFSVSGTVTDRIDGSPLSGSRITFRGQETKDAPVSNGQYSIGDLQIGSYEVTIAGPAHVEHKNLHHQVRQDRNDFTVLEWNSCHGGECYTEEFHEFFNRIARTGYEFGSTVCGTCGIDKWDPLPKEIYVMRDDSVMSPGAFDAFMQALTEVNNESVPLIYGGRTGPLPIVVGPPIEKREGTIRVKFFYSPTQHPTGGADCGVGPDVRRCGIFNENVYDLERFGYYFGTKNNVLHELYHIAFASHVFTGMGVAASVMAGSNSTTRVTPRDILASHLVYHPDTHPGNQLPDTNPQ
jgi:hypothetical protein